MDAGFDRNGNLYVLASNISYLYGASCGDAIYKYKSDGAGGILWASDTSDLSRICTNGMLTDVNGNCYLFGSWAGSDSVDYCLLAKISSAGIELWKRLIRPDSLPYMQFSSGCFDSFGNVAVTGFSQYFNDESFAFKFDSSGNVIWEHTIKSDSGAILSGIIRAKNSGDYIINAVKPLNTIELTELSGSSGDIIWSKSILWDAVGISADRLLIDHNDNIYAAGQAFYGAAIDPKYLLKTDSAGNLIWKSGSDDDGQYYADYVLAATMDSAGYCYLTTQHLTIIGNFNLQVVPEIEKFNSQDGSKMWSYIYGENATGFNLNNVLTDITCSNHKIYATGFFSPDGGQKKFLTFCMDENGHLLWSDLYGDSHLPDRAFAITANDSFGVYVTGANSDSTNPSALTIKYNLTTGISTIQSSVNELIVFPTIANSSLNFNITSKENAMARLEITDALGRIRQTIYTGEICAQSKSISYDCTTLPNGIYFATLETENGLTTKMFLKQ